MSREPAPDPRIASRRHAPPDPPAPPWFDRALVEHCAKKFGTPFYLYSLDTVRARCEQLTRAFPSSQMRYAMKANSSRAILRAVRSAGVGVDTVSAWEVRLAREERFRPSEIIYSGSNPSDDELRSVHRAGVLINLDSLSALERFGRVARGARVSLRLNLEIGGGHHPHVVTAGPDSKFGLSRQELVAARRIAKKHALRIVGIHQHVGSGIFELDLFERALRPLFSVAREFGALELLDIGGGFGVPYRADEPHVDLPTWGARVTKSFQRFCADIGRPITLVLEPGRFVVADAGLLVTRVTSLKRTRDRTFVGVDSGMHHLVRPAMYGSYHAVYPLVPRRTAHERCFVVGPICESGDVIAENRWMSPPREGDLLAVGNAGAYGYTMASFYNLRARPAEVVVDRGRVRLARRADRYEEVVGRATPSR